MYNDYDDDDYHHPSPIGSAQPARKVAQRIVRGVQYFFMFLSFMYLLFTFSFLLFIFSFNNILRSLVVFHVFIIHVFLLFVFMFICSFYGCFCCISF